MGGTISIRLILDSRVGQRLLQSVVVRVISLNNSCLVTVSSRMARVVKGVGHISVSGRIVMRLMSSLFSVSFMN